MITALILGDAPVEDLALTVTALVPGVADGLVADAVVLTNAPRPEIDLVAEAVGAKVAVTGAGANRWSAGARVARRDWLLCLEAGDEPVEGWVRAVERFLQRQAARNAVGRLARPTDLRGRLVQCLDRFAGTRRIRAGDLVHRALLTERGLVARQRPVRIPARIECGPGP